MGLQGFLSNALFKSLRSVAKLLKAGQQPGVKLSFGELKRQFVQVGAGRRLKPKAWPGDCKVAVALGFDVDNASPSLAQGERTPHALSRGEYGAVDGLPRILRLLERHKIPATFFMPALCAELHPQMIPDILASQTHEIGVHGWVHEHVGLLNDEAEERRLLTQSIAYLTKATGRRPSGYRAPGWAFSAQTMKLLQEAGLLYDSSLMASDDAYEVLLAGQKSGVIELPVTWILDDHPYFGSTATGALPSPELVLQIYRSEFDVACGEGGLFILTMHPHLIGHRSRVKILDELIQHMKTKSGVWFATHEQVATHVKETCASDS
jgi:peptidoglycan/xylan/chitin deacetylase (PgdA/CDA1 family)